MRKSKHKKVAKNAKYYKDFQSGRSRQKQQAIKQQNRERKRRGNTDKTQRKQIRKSKTTNALRPASYAKHVDNLIEAATPNMEKELCKKNLGKQKERTIRTQGKAKTKAVMKILVQQFYQNGKNLKKKGQKKGSLRKCVHES